MKRMSYRLMDLFAGCGGMTRGFVDTGRFAPVFAVESDTDAAFTYGENFGHDHVEPKEIEEIETFPPVDVVIGGPPCQGFSTLSLGTVRTMSYPSSGPSPSSPSISSRPKITSVPK
jgi:site-specific DNA-cytosine methylase